MSIKFPKHACALYLEHNPHKNMYETVEDYTKGSEDEYWISLEEKQKAIDTNELWKLRWYPDTPVGFYTLLASSLDALLYKANE